MNEKLTADQIFIEETIKAFEEQNNTTASDEDKKRIELLMRKQTHFTVAVATAERFAAQEKLHAKKEVQEHIERIVSGLINMLRNSTVDKQNVASNLCRYFNYELFQAEFPLISFEVVSPDKLSCTIKDKL